MDRLRPRTGDPEVRAALETAEHLGRAVRAFHLEAIRFRMFGLTRFLERTSLEDAADLRALAAEVRESLERAGFQMRSV
jgi:2'-5' RNA ligase